MGKKFEPNIDGTPTTPPADGQTTPPAGSDNAVTITREEWDSMRQRLDSFEQGHWNTAPPPQQPAAPTGPTVAEQLKMIETDIDDIDDKINDAVVDGKPVKSLMKKRGMLERQYTRLQIQSEDIKPMQDLGLSAIDQLSDRVTRSDMPHYELVKKDYEKHLAGLSREQRANPEVRAMAYKLAVGDNFDKIFNAQMEQKLREQAAATPSPDVGGAGREQKLKFNDEEVPSFESVMSAEAQKALRDKKIDPDTYYRKWGYPGGWPEFWSKHKDFI